MFSLINPHVFLQPPLIQSITDVLLIIIKAARAAVVGAGSQQGGQGQPSQTRRGGATERGGSGVGQGKGGEWREKNGGRGK